MKSPAEYQKAYRERRKISAEALERSLAPSLYRQPLFSFRGEHGTPDLGFYVDVLGENWWSYEDDNGIVPAEAFTLVQEDLDKASNSLGKAEFVIATLLDAAVELAQWVNDYKLSEINARIEELEQADLSDPAAKKQALANIVTLTKIRDELSKSVRWTLPQWKVKGE